MKHVKKFESFFKNPFKSKDKESQNSYKSDYAEVLGNISDDEILVLKTIDLLRDNGFDIKDGAGAITDGADVWVVRPAIIALRPDYKKKTIFVEKLRKFEAIGTVNFSSPDKMAMEIENILNTVI